MHGLLIYYFSGDNRADEPVTVNSETALDDVLTDILVNPQPHLTVVYAQNRPTDRRSAWPGCRTTNSNLISITQHHVAAVHLFGPKDLLLAEVTSDANDTTVWITLPQQTDTWVPSGVTLYIDRDTRTEFPKNAILSITLLRELLYEFMRTGKSPTCVDWRQTDIF
jgi:hypothetical protein